MAKLEHLLVRPYRKGDNKHTFACGNDTLNRYFKTRLSQDIKRNLAAGYVLWDESKATVAGYFTVSAVHVILQDVPGNDKLKLPYDELPFLLLGRLAVDDKYKGQGIGKHLMMAVFQLALELQDKIGLWGIAVDPINDQATTFYQRLGFDQLKNDNRMFISLKTIATSFQEN